MRMVSVAVTACTLAVLAAAPTLAAQVDRTFDVSASGFTDFDINPGPIDAFAASYTVVFDPSSNIDGTTSGLTVNSNSFPSTTEYGYQQNDDAIAFSTDVSIVSGDLIINPGLNGYGLFIYNATSSAPTLDFVEYTVDGIGYDTRSGSVSYTDTVSAAPEPSIWAMMAASVGLVGAMLRHNRRRSDTAAVAA